METEKLYCVRYVGSGVVTLGRAGKFMPGTVAYLAEHEARAAAALEDFVVDGLAEASGPTAQPAAAPAPAPAPPAPAPPAPAPPAPAPAPPKPAPAAVAPPAPAAPQPAELARHVVAWRSERTQCDTRLVRWGHAGRAVLVLPPAGGDAETVERMQLVDALRPLLDAGKLKLYSVDDVAGRALVAKDGAPPHRMWLLDQFHEYLAREVVPAMKADGAGEPAIAAGAGLGALHAAALVARYPELFSHALCASGIFQLAPYLDGAEATDELRAASPLDAVPRLADGAHLEAVRTRFIVCACGDEDTSESVALADALGKKGIPHRVDPWGAAAGREWAAWRAMFPKYLAEWLG